MNGGDIDHAFTAFGEEFRVIRETAIGPVLAEKFIRKGGYVYFWHNRAVLDLSEMECLSADDTTSHDSF